MATLALGTAYPPAAHQARQATPGISHPVEWAGKGIWLKADIHVHSTFSDGRSSIDELAERAARNGCDVLAVTDHTDGNLRAATPEYHAALGAARARHSGLLLITGVEWNVPPGGGRDHAVLLFPPEMDDAAVTSEFKRRFDDERRTGAAPDTAAAFEWLRDKASGASVMPVMFLSHPSRHAPSLSAVRTAVQSLIEIGPGIFEGVEGAPGHQHAVPLGAYGGALQPDDRWDPAVAPNGAIWDQLLADDRAVSGALATSDFHSEPNGDYWPCQFSSTWIYAPDRTVTGVLRALHAGSFFGVHGDIALNVQLLVSGEGSSRPAIPGERLDVPAGWKITVELRADVPPTDWQGQANHLDRVELLGVTSAGTTVLRSGALEGGVLRHELVVPNEGIAIRARGRRVIDNGPDLLFYTNAVQVR